MKQDERGGAKDSATQGLSAAALESQITEAATSEAQLQARLAGLVSRRNDLLIRGSDSEVDVVEADLAAVTRQLDRLELRIPLLRARHAEQLAAEQVAARHAEFEAAAAERVDAAGLVDNALLSLDAALKRLSGAGDRLARIGLPQGSTAERDLMGALRWAAPRAHEAFGITEAVLVRRAPLAMAERERMVRIRLSRDLADPPAPPRPREPRPDIAPACDEDRHPRYRDLPNLEVPQDVA